MTPLVYTFLGSSRDIAVGPVAVVSLLLGSMLTDEISDYKNHDYVRLAFTATFFAGITQMALGIFRYMLVKKLASNPILISKKVCGQKSHDFDSLICLNHFIMHELN